MAKYPGYRWVVERGLVGWAPFTELQPWYFLPEEEMFDATERWPIGPSDAPLLVFARRQDCDDLACFRQGVGNTSEVVEVEGWSQGGNSYDIIRLFPTFWEWLKSVIDDIADWSALTGRE